MRDERTAAVCLRCLRPLGSPHTVKRRQCPACGKWYHAKPCYVEHQRLHRDDPRKNWNYRRFGK